MRRRLLLSYVAIVGAMLVMLELPLALTQEKAQREALVTRVERDALGMASLSDDLLEKFDATTAPRKPTNIINKVADTYARESDARVVITDRNGTVLIDTTDANERAETRDFSTRPEIAAALEGKTSTGDRESRTLGYPLLYVSVPVASGGSIHGAVRISYPLTELDRRIWTYRFLLIAIGVATLIGALVLGAFVSRWALAPVTELANAIGRLQRGDRKAVAVSNTGPPELRHVTDEFNRMVVAIDHLMTSQEQFVADASHQLRTPLTALRLQLETMANSTAVTGDQVASALAEVERLSALTDALMALTRAQGDAKIVSVDARAVAAGRIAIWRDLAASSGVALSATESTDPSMCHCLETGLEQILDCLIDNAIAACAADGGDVTVTVQSHNGTVEVRVDDTGVGISEQDAQRAFDRFWQGASAGTSGLGLAIVRRIAEASGGTATIRPRTDGNRGTTAVVTLPSA